MIMSAKYSGTNGRGDLVVDSVFRILDDAASLQGKGNLWSLLAALAKYSSPLGLSLQSRIERQEFVFIIQHPMDDVCASHAGALLKRIFDDHSLAKPDIQNLPGIIEIRLPLISKQSPVLF